MPWFECLIDSMLKSFLSFLLLGFFCFSDVVADSLSQKTHPITFTLKKLEKDKYHLQMELPSNYGFQKDAPHRILLSTKGSLVVKKADLSLLGPTHHKKPEYFEYVKAMPLVLEGTGELELNAKIFYCDFKKNICIPGKVSEILSVP